MSRQEKKHTATSRKTYTILENSNEKTTLSRQELVGV
jgi:hypothetical protein